MNTPTWAVELDHVTKEFRGSTAVRDVSLKIADGEFFSLLGPSGCGKTTLLRMIAGFENPSSGDIYIEGELMGETPANQRDVNTVFQSYALFPHMSVAENVAFGLHMKKINKADVATRVKQALDMVQLHAFGERRPKQLSGGQQQRVALARALINEPEVLLLDEPLAALDLKLRKEMQLELKSIQQRLGITFIFVTHDQEEALTMSDRIAVMELGKVLQVGQPTEIYERPKTRFVADFIGECNFIDGTVMAVENGAVTLETTGGVRVVGTGMFPVAAGDHAVLAVRPEKVRLVEGQQPQGTNVFAAIVERVAYIGSDTRIIVRLPDGSPFDVWEANTVSTLDPNQYYTAGDPVFVTWATQNSLILER
ncbi:ABC transporter ATP-binding protein [Herpetosiphon llansteffanensis]|uniref:ABC transporter ATP-binding protein n=1 Tax=Herpetosiphon llansteffanensis TaxID=2094568 RepID=UPI000D7C9704|nr:ABC transporter ATP-binding protein [Herpetosiphon llansteffanensis]